MAEIGISPAPVIRIPVWSSVMALSAGITWSLGAVTTVAATESDAWQYLLWRSVAVLVVVELLARLRGRRSSLKTAYTSGWLMVTACFSLFLASVSFIYALKTTTAANTAFLASITPLVAVVLARVFLGERLTKVTVGALMLAMIGLTVMVVADLGAGRMSGNVAAMMSSVGFASYTVCIRADPSRDWSPVLTGYAALMIVVCAAVTWTTGRPFVPSGFDLGMAVVHGGILIVVGTYLFNVASRSIPAVAMTVFAQTETVFVPVWIFLVFGEKPGAASLVGAAIILTAIVGKAVLDAKPGELRPHRAVPGAIE
ncbi:MAG: DMT family transporter [Acidimicrobiia bacterium]|nr:DMT family transporter [Acidimicrobiia bacterium]MDH4308251.1 DMT family transporter [Acidimicrobiia bacterium]MDH5293615.1 DMT family transporter [Acidimicrobiia bacterium]